MITPEAAFAPLLVILILFSNRPLRIFPAGFASGCVIGLGNTQSIPCGRCLAWHKSVSEIFLSALLEKSMSASEDFFRMTAGEQFSHESLCARRGKIKADMSDNLKAAEIAGISAVW